MSRVTLCFLKGHRPSAGAALRWQRLLSWPLGPSGRSRLSASPRASCPQAGLALHGRSAGLVLTGIRCCPASSSRGQADSGLRFQGPGHCWGSTTSPVSSGPYYCFVCDGELSPGPRRVLSTAAEDTAFLRKAGFPVGGSRSSLILVSPVWICGGPPGPHFHH